jgi:hypothetical protein
MLSSYGPPPLDQRYIPLEHLLDLLPELPEIQVPPGRQLLVELAAVYRPNLPGSSEGISFEKPVDCPKILASQTRLEASWKVDTSPTPHHTHTSYSLQ